jgi:hypothetical protein
LTLSAGDQTLMSSSTATATAAPQQINVADLDLPQLAEVKRQLEEVRALLISRVQAISFEGGRC